MRWFQPLLNAICSLDEAVDRAAARFHEHATPAIAGAAAQLDVVLTLTSERAVSATSEALVDLDERWQHFMIKRVDPMFGQTRTSQLAEMSLVEISPAEVALNRQVGKTLLFLAVIIGGGAIFPPSLFVTVPLSATLLKPIYQTAARTVKKQGRVTHHVVSAVNVTGVWLAGYYRPAIAAMLFFFMSEKLLMVTQDRSHKGIIAIFAKQPQSVWVLVDGVEVERPFTSIAPGDVLVVDAGGFMPVDGTIVEGLASIDQQMLTGEAQPVEKSVGDAVYASTQVLGGRVHVRVEKAGSDTVAAKIGEALNRTASYQLDLQTRGTNLANRLALPTLVLSGVALGTVGMPGALGILNTGFGATVRISAPVTMLNLLNIAAENAILLKDGRSLELLSDIDTVLFDKTGTLTMSQPHVAAIHCVDDFDAERVLTYAAAAEHRQTHPIALAVVAEARARDLPLPDIDHARYEIGYGILVELDGRTIQVGSDRFMTRSGIAISPEINAQQRACHARGHSLIMVAVDGALAGAIELQPTIRPEVRSVLADLRGRGLKLMVVSGDQDEPTRRLAESLGIDRYFANVLPEGKAALVEKLQAEGRAVCFIGDGINDSIALKKANVSVSLRGATTAATDAAQVVLMQESLEKLPFLFGLADDMERSLRAGMAVGFIPGVITVGGVFLAGWGFTQALGLYVLSMTTAMGIAMYPLYKHRKGPDAPSAPSAPRALVAASTPETA